MSQALSSIPNYKPITSAIICLIVAPLFFLGGPDYYSSDSYRYFWNFGHPLFFALANYTLLNYISRQTERTGLYFFITALSFTAITGIGIELIQAGSSRTPSLGDIARNFLGMAIALFFFLPARKSLPIYLTLAGQLLCLAGLLSMLWILLSIVSTEQARRQALPLLFDFESPESLRQIGGGASKQLSRDFVARGNTSLRITLTPDLYSGIGLRRLAPDWSDYQSLSLSLFNPDLLELALTLRIDDVTHSRNPKGYSDRFNRRLKLAPGWNHIDIPLKEIQQAPKKRLLDLSAISRISLFSGRLPNTRQVYLDNVHLKPKLDLGHL